MAFIKAATLAEIPPGTARRAVVGGVPIALCNVDGEIYAIHDICSHALASLSEGYLSGHVLECPRHGAQFDVRTGAALTLPATRPVATYRVQLEGDAIMVEVPDAKKA